MKTMYVCAIALAVALLVSPASSQATVSPGTNGFLVEPPMPPVDGKPDEWKKWFWGPYYHYLLTKNHVDLSKIKDSFKMEGDWSFCYEDGSDGYEASNNENDDADDYHLYPGSLEGCKQKRAVASGALQDSKAPKRRSRCFAWR